MNYKLTRLLLFLNFIIFVSRWLLLFLSIVVSRLLGIISLMC